MTAVMTTTAPAVPDLYMFCAVFNAAQKALGGYESLHPYPCYTPDSQLVGTHCVVGRTTRRHKEHRAHLPYVIVNEWVSNGRPATITLDDIRRYRKSAGLS